MAGGIDGKKPRGRGDPLKRGGHFVEGAEAVARAVNEEGGRAERRKVRGAELRGLFRRMQGIGEEQQRVGEAGRGGGEHGRLASAVGMAAEKDAGAEFRAQQLDGAAQALLVAFGFVARRAVRAELAEGQVAAKHGNSLPGEFLRKSHKQRRVAVRSGAVGEDERGGGIRGRVKKAADGRVVRGRVFEGLNAWLAHDGGGL